MHPVVHLSMRWSLSAASSLLLTSFLKKKKKNDSFFQLLWIEKAVILSFVCLISEGESSYFFMTLHAVGYCPCYQDN